MQKGDIMTIELFIFLFTIGSAAASLLTEALKKAFGNLPSNILALASSFVIGIGGSAIAYVLMDIPGTQKNIVCVILMPFCIWVSAMVGYDKIMQLIGQIRKGA